MPKKTRKYPTKKKTTTEEGKRNYMQRYMRNYRRQRTEAIRKLRIKYPDTYKQIFGKRKREK